MANCSCTFSWPACSSSSSSVFNAWRGFLEPSFSQSGVLELQSSRHALPPFRGPRPSAAASPAIAARDLFSKKWIHKKSGTASPVGEEEEAEEGEGEEGEEDAIDDGDGAPGLRAARRMKRRVEFHGSRARPGRPSPSPPLHRLLFQSFNWESPKKYPWYHILRDQVDEITLAGITDVWLPPPSQSVDANGYLPSQLYDLDDSKYGTKEQLEELIDLLHVSGVCCIADIVINHRSAWRQDSSGHWNLFEGGTEDERLDWGPWAVVDDDSYDSGGKGQHDTGESYEAAPDLDHTNKRVQDELSDWMNWMKADVGFDGWRFDFVKGYAAEFVKLYCARTEPTFSVGELWTSMVYDNGSIAYDQNAHRQVLCDWIDGTGGTACAFDFTTKGILQVAVGGQLWRLKDLQGKPPGLIGWYPQRAVTFIDNHDTGSTQRRWNFPDDKVLLGYVYILTHPGIPCIFYDHFFSWGIQKNISDLTKLRKRLGINAASKITIEVAEADLYVANVENRLIVKIGSRFEMGSLLPDPGQWKLAMSGHEFAIWEPVKMQSGLEKRKQGRTLEISVASPQRSEVIRSTYPLNLSDKMSCRTVRRILREVPELVRPESRSTIVDLCQGEA